jgi:hypothetical protein
MHRNRSTKSGKTKIKAGKPSVANTYKYNAIGNKPMTTSQTIQTLKKKKGKTIKMKGRSLR